MLLYLKFKIMDNGSNMTDGARRTVVGPALVGNACILIATIFWGVNISVTKALIPEWMTAEGIAAVRILGGCVLFWLASLFVRRERILRGDWMKLILGGAIGLFSFIYLFVMVLKYANPIDVSIIMTLPPMFVILINVIFRHRRPRILEYVDVALGVPVCRYTRSADACRLRQPADTSYS